MIVQELLLAILRVINLYADSNAVEGGGSSTAIQFDSNGFTVKGTDTMVNASGGTYIYMAFAGGMDSISDYNTDWFNRLKG